MNSRSIKKNLIVLLVPLCILIVGFLFFITNREKLPEKNIVTPQAAGTIISGKFDEKSFKTNDEWKHILTPEQYYILREAGTEVPFTGKLNHETRKGTYYSAGCDKPLFRSEKKYDSGTGWPSFWAPIDKDAVVLRRESALGDDRIEVLDTCGNHLGHVFDDGPEPTGKRYCMNSIALKFVPDKNQ